MPLVRTSNVALNVPVDGFVPGFRGHHSGTPEHRFVEGDAAQVLVKPW
jgi:hypothetical protein